MPFYDYECVDCGHGFSVFMTLRELEEASSPIACPKCGSDNVKKKISGFVAQTSRKS
jgi:putative FmdB family regulatory protein